MSVGESKAEVTEDTPESGVGMLQVPDDVPKTSHAFVKNAYFTYTDGHRESVQVWNVNLEGGIKISVYVQGPIPEILGAGNYTYFAKKHLLTFKGGKAESDSKGQVDKTKRIVEKRKRASQGKEEWAKYGSAKPDDVNTFVICDKLSPEALRSSFAWSLYLAEQDYQKLPTNKRSKRRAVISFEVACVADYKVNDKQLKKLRRGMAVNYVVDGSNYYVLHYTK